MESGKHALPLTGLMLALGLVASTYLISNVIRDIRSVEQIIKVRGYAETFIESDLAMWHARFEIRTQDIQEGYEVLDAQRVQVAAYLAEKGVGDDEIVWPALSIGEKMVLDEERRPTNEIDYYEMSQSFNITSRDVHRIKTLSAEIAELVRQGIYVRPTTPNFLYSKTNDLKEALLAEATRDARMRAETLAKGSGMRLGGLRAARQGVFGLRSANASAIDSDSDSSSDDTYSIPKKITAVVTVDYAIR